METLGLWYQYGPKSETSTLKQAFQLQTSFWSGSDMNHGGTPKDPKQIRFNKHLFHICKDG